MYISQLVMILLYTRQKLRLVFDRLVRIFPTRGSSAVPVKSKIDNLEYLRAIAKELREPIDTIAGYSEILYRTPEEAHSAQMRLEYHAAMLASSRQLQRLINELAETTRIGSSTVLDVQVFDVAELLEATAHGLQDETVALRSPLLLRVIEEVEVTADLARLRKVVHYLLAEALKVTSETECIYLDMYRSVRDDLEIVLACVEDWQPDLTFALAIISLHGGQIALNKQAPKSSEVRIILPSRLVRWPKYAKKLDVA